MDVSYKGEAGARLVVDGSGWDGRARARAWARASNRADGQAVGANVTARKCVYVREK